MKKVVIGILSLLFAANALLAQTVSGIKGNRLDSIFTAYTKNYLFNGSVLVYEKGQVLLSKGYGIANANYQIPCSPQTKFKLASVSKHFTACAILQLAEKGKINLKEPISKIIPDYPNGNKITVHHLLNHTSGIPNFTSFPEYDSLWRTQYHSLPQLIDHFKNRPLDFEPGAQWSYSNSAYILLSYIIEKASGLSFNEYMQKNIFDALGMKNSGVFDNTKPYSNLANGYYEENEKLYNVNFIDMTVPSGAGALFSTTEDLLIWYKALIGNKILTKESFKKMCSSDNKEKYGYGLGIDTIKGIQMLSHGGGIEGFATHVAYFPEKDAAVIILKNVDNLNLFSAPKVARQVLFGWPLTLPAPRKIAQVNPEIYKNYCGDYELMPGFVMTVRTRENRIFTQATSQPEIEIYPESETKFFVKVVDAQIEFKKTDDGKSYTLFLYQGGQTLKGNKK